MQRTMKIQAVGGRVIVGEPTDQVVLIPRPLLTLFQRKGIGAPADGTHLSAEQLERVLAGAGTRERLSIKLMCEKSDILPRVMAD
jgi:hypothetical protein